MQLKVEKTVQKFDRNKIKKILTEENDYICNLLTVLDVPERIERKTIFSSLKSKIIKKQFNFQMKKR